MSTAARSCPVCSGPMGGATGREERNVVYGGICCPSCRAFFRRINQQQKADTLRCIFGDDCTPSMLRQRRCPKCRFRLCLQSGMRPELVLSAREKERRFHRAFAKKKESGNEPSSKAGNDAEICVKSECFDLEEILAEPAPMPSQDDNLATNLADFHLETKSKSQMKDVETQRKVSDSDASMSSGGTFSQRSSGRNSSIDSDSSDFGRVEDAERDELSSKVDMAFEGKDDNDKMLESHGINPDMFTPHVVKAELLKALDENLKLFSELATKEFESDCFGDLEDRDHLMKQNEMLFINLIFGKFLSVGGRMKTRLHWLKVENNKANLKCLMHEPNDLVTEILRLFGNDQVLLNAYLGFVESLNGFENVPPPSFKEELAKVLVFYPGTLTLNNQKAVSQHFFQRAMNLTNGRGWVMPIEEVYELCKTLEAMCALFSHGGITNDLLSCNGKTTSIKPLALEYTQEEELWFLDKKIRMLEAMQSVHMPPDLLMDAFNLIATGTPPGPDHHWRMFNVCKQRVWKMYQVHPVFQEQSSMDQSNIVTSSARLIFALITAFLDGVPPEQHPQFMLSPEQRELDMGAQNLIQILPKKNSTTHVFKTACPFVPPEWEAASLKVQRTLRDKKDYDWMFAVMTTCLFNSVTHNLPKSSPKVRALESLKMWFYLSQARRYGGDYETRIQDTFQDVRSLAGLLPSYY